MINDNRKYDTSGLRPANRNRIEALQKLFVFLSITAVVMGLILIGAFIGRKNAVSELEASGQQGAGIPSLDGSI